MDPQEFLTLKQPVITPQKILLIGTPGSGKTTLAEYLAKDTGFSYGSIDECRIRYGDGTLPGEDRAWDHFLKDCSRPAPQILEFSGMGPHAGEVLSNLVASAMPVSVIWLVLPLETCISRALQRQKTIPFPYPLAPIGYAVPAIHHAIEDTWKNLWSNQPLFHATRQEFRTTDSVTEMYSVIRRICLCA
jgi:hypothetical protein